MSLTGGKRKPGRPITTDAARVVALRDSSPRPTWQQIGEALDISEGTAIRVYKQAKGETVKPKASTLQERFGFKDDELSTPKHDEIMMWLNENAEQLFPSGNGPWSEQTITRVRDYALEEATNRFPAYYRDQEPLTEYRKTFSREVEARKLAGIPDEGCKALKRAVLTDSPPDRALCRLTKTWEWPIMSGYGKSFNVGFVDMLIQIHQSRLSWDWPKSGNDDLTWKEEQGGGSDRPNILIEVKPEIRSLGEVIRQIRMYESHIEGRFSFYVCCPDTRFREQLLSQKIGFIEALVSSPNPVVGI